MSFEEHVCYCINKSGDEVDGDGAYLPDCVSMNYIGDGIWKCPDCGHEDDEHIDDIFKARVRVYFEEYKSKKYLCAEIIPPFNDKLTNPIDEDTTETGKECLEEFLNDNCYGAIRGHAEGVFDMEVLFYDYATGGDGGEREVVIEVCKETPVKMPS
jgi:hypothetical protein